MAIALDRRGSQQKEKKSASRGWLPLPAAASAPSAASARTRPGGAVEAEAIAPLKEAPRASAKWPAADPSQEAPEYHEGR